VKDEEPKKHPCVDCTFCQWCSDDRCQLCRGEGCARRKLSQAEQIALFERINCPPVTSEDRCSTDSLRHFGLTIRQPVSGYRFSLDPLLLCDFVVVNPGDQVIDLGTGCGVMPLALAQREVTAQFVGVDFQPEMAVLAKENATANGFIDRITIETADILQLRTRYPDSCFDLVISNPPYRTPGSGKISPRAGRDLARHESTATLGDFLAIAKYLVKPSGRICMIYHPERLAEFIAEATALKLATVRLQMVHGTIGAEARMFLVELVKGRKGTLQILPPLVVRNADGSYTADRPWLR
jgi:tRNA1Val (adenine37-N6)-methyltransferase